jgi:hypothetical protein
MELDRGIAGCLILPALGTIAPFFVAYAILQTVPILTASVSSALKTIGLFELVFNVWLFVAWIAR